MKSSARLVEKLKAARLFQRQRESSPTLVWYGTERMHQLDDEGNEVDSWDLGSCDETEIYDMLRFNRLPGGNIPDAQS